MTQKEMLELFINGSIIHENVSVVLVEDGTDMKRQVGAVDAQGVRNGRYLVYYEPIERSYEDYVTPDYTLHDEDGNAIYLQRIEDADATKNVSSYFFYMWNAWCEEECKLVFEGADYRHLWNKWCQACNSMNGARGAAEFFYMMLSDTNRERVVRRATELYDGHTERNL